MTLFLGEKRCLVLLVGENEVELWLTGDLASEGARIVFILF